MCQFQGFKHQQRIRPHEMQLFTLTNRGNPNDICGSMSRSFVIMLKYIDQIIKDIIDYRK